MIAQHRSVSPPTSRPEHRPSVLREAAFLRLWTATTASGLATWALPFILGFAVVDRTITAKELGTVLAARTVGFLVAVPVAGVLADRCSRRTVVLIAGLAAATATPLIAVGLGRSVVLMAAAGVVVGIGQGACRPAFQALTAEVVDPSRRQQANAAITLAVHGTSLITPGFTTLLINVLDLEVLILGTGLLWFVAASAPPSGRPAPSTESSVNSFVSDLIDGVSEARRHPWYVAGLAALTAVITTGYSATGVVLPLVSRDRYGTESLLAGATTALTVGSLVGSLLVARWRPRSQGWVALAGLSCYGFAPLSLLLPVHAAVVVLAYLVTGIGLVLFNVLWFTAEQREIEPRLLARVSSLDFLLSYGFAPVGLALMAPAIDAFGAKVVLGTCALTCFLAPAAAAFVPSARDFSQTEDHSAPRPPPRVEA